MDALDSVLDALEGASVDLSEKRIIWSDGQRLTIEQSAERIQERSGLERLAIINHLIGWLQMEYVPEGLDDKQMEMFESHIDAWIDEFEENGCNHQARSNSILIKNSVLSSYQEKPD